jgi:NAD(P)-dependent dehydrogenase (short-subunit alcohol dehydrogenase family)
MKLDSKSAIVTGAGSGTGKSVAMKLSEHGANVAAVDVDLRSAQGTVSLIKSSGNKAIAVKADISDKRQVIEMKDTVLREYGAIDILINNAGIMSPPTPIEELPEQDWDRIIAVNLKGVFLCSQVVGREMIKRNQGCILNIASISGHGPYPLGGAYSSTKAGVLVLTQQLALEWGKYNIRVNSISPGMIRTPLNEKVFGDHEIREKRKNLVPLRRIGMPEDIASAAVFLVSDDASFITGTDVFVDGGFMTVLQQLIPGRAGAK